jgi:acyl dehydratase
VSTRIFETPQQLFACAGQEIAVSDWITLDQRHINMFADATEDHQWIHVDLERAKAGPYGSTIAHGFLTLSLVSRFYEQALKINGVREVINYGVNRVRFPSPVPVNSRLRGHIKLNSVEQAKDGSYQVVWGVVIEREGGEKPACVAETLERFYL